MPKAAPEIVQYAEYRRFLADRYRFLRLNNRKFSHRYINYKMAISSSGWFGDIIAGRQRLKPSHIRKISAVFLLSQKEQAYFAALVNLENAVTDEDRDAALGEIYRAKGMGQQIVSAEKIRFYHQWYYSGLRELLCIYPGARNPEILAAFLDPPITPKQAKEALTLLEKLGLTSAPETKGGKLTSPILIKDASVRTKHWNKMIAAMMKLGRRALRNFGRDERNISGLTLAFSAEGLKQAGEEIAALRKRLLYLSEKDKGRNRVYHGLFQLYPISKSLEV
jgi:uncharacterized protein (TIGR02147 family)